VRDHNRVHVHERLSGSRQYFFDSSDQSGRQPDFDTVGMSGGIRQNIRNDSFRQFPGALILLQNNAHPRSSLNIRSIPSIHCYSGSFV
jgi:hypothetical protein